jgi:hypothetical protein
MYFPTFLFFLEKLYSFHFIVMELDFLTNLTHFLLDKFWKN